jgi:hypothetical protein
MDIQYLFLNWGKEIKRFCVQWGRRTENCVEYRYIPLFSAIDHCEECCKAGAAKGQNLLVVPVFNKWHTQKDTRHKDFMLLFGAWIREY